MKNFTTAKALALSLLCATLPAIAGKSYDNDDYRDECCGSPLYCGGFAIQVTGGIAPTLWNNRDAFLFANAATSTTVCPVVQLSSLGCLPKFSSLYQLPWDVGFRLSYAVTEKFDIGFDFDYRQAKSKYSSGCNVTTTTQGQLTLCYTTSLDASAVPAIASHQFIFTNICKYKAYAGHASARWYSERYWCDAVAFFIGLKVGFIHHNAIDATLNLYTVSTAGVYTSSPLSPFPNLIAPLYYSNNTISAGGTVGLDWCFWNRLSFIAQVEFLGNGPLTNNPNFGGPSQTCNSGCNSTSVAGTNACNTTVALATSNTAATSNLVVPAFNCEVQFPITFGFKYYF